MPGMWPDRIEGKTCAVNLPKFAGKHPYMPIVLTCRENVVKSFIAYIDRGKLSSSQVEIALECFDECLLKYTQPEFWYIASWEWIISKLVPEMQQKINEHAQRNLKLCPWGELTFDEVGDD